MEEDSDIAAICRRFRTVGSALMRINFNNTHSGNMSCRDRRNPGRFWITASGAQCGDLSSSDLVSVRFDDMSHARGGRPSSETNTHRRVLELPGVRACVHCHSIASTLIGFETPQEAIFRPKSGDPQPEETDSHFQPVDVWGAGLIGSVRLGGYRDSVGSAEMEKRIPTHLKQAPITVVKGHGPFARGRSLEECLHFLGILESSAMVAIALRRRGIDILTFQQAIITQGVQAVFAWLPSRLDWAKSPPVQEIDPVIRAEFTSWLSYNFELGLGAFGTGSMSRMLSDDEIIFCPMSAAPRGIFAPLRRIRLHAAESETADVQLHRRVYTRTPFRACMLTASPLSTAEAMATLASAYGVKALAGTPQVLGRPTDKPPTVAPVDAEALHLKFRPPVAGIDALATGPGEGAIPALLETGNGCCLIAGAGVIAAGENSLSQAAYRVSLAERIARFRQEVDLNHRLLGGPALPAFE